MHTTNVFGDEVITCSTEPLTGYFRDGCCNTDGSDQGVHTVCVVATEEFLAFSKSIGNDLSTPQPQWKFDGVRPGDRWCLCAARFLQAHQNNAAPLVILEATNEKTLEIVTMEILLQHAHYGAKN
ncbi:MAG: hypothetical protein ACI9GM_001447 [Salibacteraceae bacterium]|jgi:uncharacterized protein (DUF2237 family)